MFTGKGIHRAYCFLAILLVILASHNFLTSPRAFAQTGSASVSGRVTDETNAVVPDVEVEIKNADTNFTQLTRTNGDGIYSFPALPPGRYVMSVRKQSFQTVSVTGIQLHTQDSLARNFVLRLGSSSESVTVSSTSANVETSATYLGEVIDAEQMTTVPLNGRSYTDLLALQPGVVPLNSNVNPTGETSPPAQSLNPGNLSIGGQRETANAFMVNGSLVEDAVQQGAAIIPNLDSMAEFRILTNGYDAEFGNYSGGQVNVVTKSGNNAYHGDAFEFLRNTNLDATDFFSPTRGAFHQNQFGGTIGGPIVHDKVFFFGDYQGTRQSIGVATGLVTVPSLQDRTGDLSDIAPALVGTVNGAGWANVLSQRLGYAVTAGEPYFTPGCTSATCVFPNAVVPRNAIAPPAEKLLPYIPNPTGTTSTGTPIFSTSQFPQTLRDDEGGIRVDGATRLGMLSAYYYLDDNVLNNPYPQSNIPGFNGLGTQRSQLAQVNDTKTWGFNKVNEFHANYVRNVNDTFKPVGGVGPSLSSFGITEGCQTLGVCILAPQYEGVPRVDFSQLGFTIGVASHIGHFFQNTYGLQDSFSLVTGTHTVKFGGQLSYDQVNEFLSSRNNGDFNFVGIETGSDFADFLIGAPTVYEQGVSAPMYSRTSYLGLFGQDSWRVSSRVTLNYGLRWDVSYPWWEKDNELETIIPGKQSAKFPGAPPGWVFPGDPGIPKTTSPVRWDNLAPRIGIAYAPKAESGFWKMLLGQAGSSSLRASFGKFFTAMGEYGSTQIIGDAPYGFFWVSTAPPTFEEPFLARATQSSEGQRFPVSFPPDNVSPSNPDRSIDWPYYEPISSSPGWNHINVLPYSLNYLLSFQRQIDRRTLLTVSYVGSQGHHLLVNLEADPSNPGLCLGLSQPSDVAPNTSTCGPFSENASGPVPTPFITAAGEPVNVRPLGPGLGSDGLYSTIGNSSYNSLQVTLRHHSGRLDLLGAYTFGKSMDDSSEINDQVNPFFPRRSIGLSAFDVKQNFVVSYGYELPFDQLFASNRLTRGWILAGITRFSTGLPVTISETDDHALIGDFATGINGETVDEPFFTLGQILANTNPRSGQSYFNTSLFTEENVGQLGDSRRRFFHGPGINSWDMSLLKSVPFTESKSLQFRFEFFNVFNHAQFANPVGEITSAAFGKVTSVDGPANNNPFVSAARVGQVGVKFYF